MKIWRKIHIYSFGYFKLLTLFVGLCMFFISITGILLNHRHDFAWIDNTRVPTSFLPTGYQTKLDDVRAAQGLEDLFPEEAHSVPLMWLIQDLHTGDVLGPWGRIFYDLIGVSFVVLVITGVYMYFKIRKRKIF